MTKLPFISLLHYKHPNRHHGLKKTDFFLKPNSIIYSPEMAYLLGLIWSDGYIQFERKNGKLKGGTISIGLQESDMYDLKNVFVKTGKWASYFRFKQKTNPTWKNNITKYIGTLQLADYLFKLGYSKNREQFPMILTTRKL